MPCYVIKVMFYVICCFEGFSFLYCVYYIYRKKNETLLVQTIVVPLILGLGKLQ